MEKSIKNEEETIEIMEFVGHEEHYWKTMKTAIARNSGFWE